MPKRPPPADPHPRPSDGKPGAAPSQPRDGSPAVAAAPPPAQPAEPRPILVLARDPAVIRAAQGAVRATGTEAPARPVGSAREALAAVLAADQPPRLLILEHGLAEDTEGLEAMLADPFGPTRAMLLHREHAEALDPRAVLAALRSQIRPAAEAGDAGTLRRGLEQDRVSVRYQPMVRLRDGAAVAAEALARWTQPPKLLAPDTFVPLVEQAGLGLALSMAVARRAAAELAGFLRRGRPLRYVSVNLPLAVLEEAGTVGWLRQILRDNGLRPHHLALELTETTPVHDPAPLRRALLRLRQAGFAVLIDDLCRDDEREALLHLPFSGVKLDRSFTTALPASARARRSAQRVVALARRHGMRVVAEGISTQAEWRAAAALSVDLAQGYAVARPMPAAVLPEWRHGWTPPALAHPQAR
ncbi:EAL domain-containing protein [Roseomonas elaeocarpi]|uniref:EAL domain-containing protein n=1 Tax=Roseomonas elaeocarpi TaxID=907779 RepID=A0ABV6JU53_9PROT